MPEDFLEHIAPIQGAAPLGPGDTGPPPVGRAHASRTVSGRIAAVHRRHPGGGGAPESGHLLDVTVGGDPVTEIVVRVPPGLYDRLEGKRVVMHIEE